MSSSREFAHSYLKAVEKKNKVFFESHILNIFDCVVIKGHTLVSVHVINDTLPDSIVYEIETMFWK